MTSTKNNNNSENSQNSLLKNSVSSKSYGKVVLTLKNQLLPDDKLTVTPSQTDGLDGDTETDLRIYGCELIQTAGILLRLPQVAMATGQVLLQRFYYSKSLVRHPVDHTAMACVCLASKIEEAPRRVRDVINVFNHIRQVNSNKFPYRKLPKTEKISARGSVNEGNRPITPVILDQNYIQLKNQVIKAERRVLKELGFCVHIKHPHKIIVMYLQVLGFEKNQSLMQYSWNYMNDSLRTDVFVRYQPETVACACIYLTARKLKLPLPKNPVWYTLFGAKETEIKDICVRILKLYSRPKPNVDVLEKKVDELRKKYQDARVRARGGGSGNDTPNNNSPSSPNAQKTTGAHNAWGGFISRSGSHVAPPVSDKRSRSKSASHSPVLKHHKRSKKHARSRSRTPTTTTRNHKKSHKRRSSYSRSRSNSPHMKASKKSRYEEKADKKDKYEKNDKKYDKERDNKYRTRDDKYSNREDKDKYKKSKHRDEEKDRDREKEARDRSKDRRR